MADEWLSRRTRAQVKRMLPAITASLSAKDNENTIDLATAENHLIQTELVEVSKDIICRRLSCDALSYPKSIGGDLTLLSALGKVFNQYFNPHVPVEASHVVAGPGATACLTSLLTTFCDTGDAVIIPGPYWNGFDIHFRLQPQVEIINIDPDLSGKDEMDAGLLPCLSQSIAAGVLWSKNVRAVVLTNPSNPSGQCYSVDALATAARFCEENNLHLIVDEVYALSQLRPSGQDAFTSILALDMLALGVDPARVHVLWSTSKDLDSSGYRLGAVVSQANDAVRASLGLLMTTQVSSLAALVTAGLLESPRLPYLIELGSQRLKASYDQIRYWLELHKLDYVPVVGGIYVLACLAPGASTWDDENAMIKKLGNVGVLVGPGRSYHLRESQKGWCRIVFAVPPHVLEEALRRIQEALDFGSMRQPVRRLMSKARYPKAR